jgi:hypothetical protein
MSAGNLRYYALASYTGLVALWTATNQIVLDDTTSIALLAPIAIVIGADYIKHKNENKA